MSVFTHVVIGSDHAGFHLKESIRHHLEALSLQTTDMGTFSTESCDYPPIAQKTCRAASEIPGSCAILVCGTGIGMSIAANRMPHIRAALCTNEFQARACRMHNNANVLCLGERVTGPGVALSIVDLFLRTQFEGGRHLRRISLLEDNE